MTKPKSGRTIETVDITPDIAREWLEKRPPHQRRVTFATVQRMARRMQEGTWRYLTNPFQFDWDGHLIDGQHRLLAVAQSGITWPGAVVVKGEDPDAFQDFDTHLRRTAAQFITDGGFTSIRTAAARYILAYRRDSELTNFKQATEAFSMKEVVEFDEQHPLLQKLAGDVSAVYTATQITSSVLLAVTAIGSEKSELLTEAWLNALRTGADLAADDSRLVLRNTFRNNAKLLNRHPERRRVFGLITKAWNAYVLEEPVQMLRFRTNKPGGQLGGTAPGGARGGEQMPRIIQPE